jgi:hypothetical protein
MKLIDLIIKENYKNIRQEGLEILKEVLIKKDCPSFYGYESNQGIFCRKQDCRRCWNRKVEMV